MRSVLRAATVVAVVAAMVGAATLAGAFATTPTPAAAPSALQDAEPTLNRTYGGQFADSGSAVVALDDGYALVGSANRSARGDAVSDVVVRRVDANGSVTSTSTVQRPGSQRPTDAVRTPGGDVVVVGTTGTGDSSDGFAARLAPDGELVWYRSYGTPGPDAFNGVVATEGGFAVAGATAGTGGEDSAWLVALDDDGVQQFARTYERRASAARDIARAGDGYVLAGRLVRSVPGRSADQTQAWAAGIAPNGNVRWAREYGTESANETAAAVASTPDGYALAGTSTPTDDDDGNEARAWYAGLAANGMERWTRSYGSRRGAFSDVATTGDDLVLVGTLGARATADVTVVRALTDGTPTQSYVTGAGESVVARSAVAGNDSVVVAGTLTAGGDSQAWLLGTAAPGSVTTPTTTTTATPTNATTTATTATTTATPTTESPSTSTATPTTSTTSAATTSTTAPTDTTTAATTTTADGLPGFTALLAVVALLAAALLAVRRR